MSAPPPQRPAYTRISRSHKGVDAAARQQERRQRLLAAGLEVLGSKGYHASTVRDVCIQAGLSERYFYESFSGLRELFETVYNGLHQEWLGRLMGILAASHQANVAPLETARIAVTAWFTSLKDDPRNARITMIDALGVTAGSEHGAQGATRDYVGALQAFLDLLYPRLPDLDLSSRITASILTGACIHAAREWIWADYATPMETVMAHLMTIFEALDDYYRRRLAGTQ